MPRQVARVDGVPVVASSMNRRRRGRAASVDSTEPIEAELQALLAAEKARGAAGDAQRARDEAGV